MLLTLPDLLSSHDLQTARQLLRNASWVDGPGFIADIDSLIAVLSRGLNSIRESFSDMVLDLRGRGLMRGLVFADAETSASVSSAAYEKAGIIAETCGSRGEVLKLLPPMVMSPQDLQLALHGLREAVAHVAHQRSQASQWKLQMPAPQYR